MNHPMTTTKTEKDFTFAITPDDGSGQINVTYFGTTEEEAKTEATADWPNSRISRI